MFSFHHLYLVVFMLPLLKVSGFLALGVLFSYCRRSLVCLVFCGRLQSSTPLRIPRAKIGHPLVKIGLQCLLIMYLRLRAFDFPGMYVARVTVDMLFCRMLRQLWGYDRTPTKQVLRRPTQETCE